MTTLAPAAANILAIGRPMLRMRPAPVTIATFPLSDCSMTTFPVTTSRSVVSR